MILLAEHRRNDTEAIVSYRTTWFEGRLMKKLPLKFTPRWR